MPEESAYYWWLCYSKNRIEDGIEIPELIGRSREEIEIEFKDSIKAIYGPGINLEIYITIDRDVIHLILSNEIVFIARRFENVLPENKKHNFFNRIVKYQGDFESGSINLLADIVYKFLKK